MLIGTDHSAPVHDLKLTAMKTIFMLRLCWKSAPSYLKRLLQMRMGAAALLVAVAQLACTEPFNFSSAAAILTFAPTDLPVHATRNADFGTAQPSSDARNVADGIVQSRDHAGTDFVIVDKKHATIYVFAADGVLRGQSAVLLGSALGDDSVPGIGSRPIDQVRPHERTTPAGRFVGERGRNILGEDIVWVDYEAAVSMHRVRATNPAERRMERLATPSADDNRISYGCINIPWAFYDSVIAPIFAAQRVVVYVLPDVKKKEEVFSFHGLSKKS